MSDNETTSFEDFGDKFFGLPSLDDMPIVNDDGTPSDEGQKSETEEGKEPTPNVDEGKSQQPESKKTEPSASIKDILVKRYSDLSIGESATDDDVFKALEERFKPKLHPAAIRLNNAIQSGKSIQEAVGALTQTDRLLAMNDEDIVAMAYQDQYGKSDKRPHGLDKDAITAHIKRLSDQGTLAFEAIKIRDGIAKLKQQEEEEFAAINTPTDWNDPKAKEQFSNQVLNPSLTKLSSEKPNVPGINWAKPDHVKTIKESLTSYLTPSSEFSGLSPFAKEVQDNFAKIALVWKLYTEGAFSAEKQKGKEQAKDSILSKLGMIPPKTSENTNIGDLDAAGTLAAFAQPSPIR